MPIIEAIEGRDYTMSSSVRELRRDFNDAYEQVRGLREELGHTRVELNEARNDALFWYRLCFILVLILVTLLVAGSIIVFRGS